MAEWIVSHRHLFDCTLWTDVVLRSPSRAGGCGGLASTTGDKLGGPVIDTVSEGTVGDVSSGEGSLHFLDKGAVMAAKGQVSERGKAKWPRQATAPRVPPRDESDDRRMGHQRINVHALPLIQLSFSEPYTQWTRSLLHAR
jgi:hypothetical protein